MSAEILNSRELFLAAASGKKTSRPPFWIMRQAGRYLPEYRELKGKLGFLGIVKTPEAAVEAALQPIRRFGFDCAILFSDILVISEALGFPYKFKDGGGIEIESPVRTAADIARAKERAPFVRENLGYVFDNLRLLRRELPDKAVLGFCGSPFTIAAYMVEGGSSPDFPKYRNFIKNSPELFKGLTDALRVALSAYAREQAECGADAVQVFDSHAALSPDGEWKNLSGSNISKIFSEIRGKTRSILFANGMSGRFGEIADIGADVCALDSSAPLSKAAARFSGALQGNLDPSALSHWKPREVAAKTLEIIEDMRPFGRHIFNLGHGILPDAKIENVEALADAVKNCAK